MPVVPHSRTTQPVTVVASIPVMPQVEAVQRSTRVLALEAPVNRMPALRTALTATSTTRTEVQLLP